MKSILIAGALALLPSWPAYCEGPNAEEIIARSRAKLAYQEAVLLSCNDDLNYFVVAAREPKIEGSLVQLRHIMGREKDNRVFIYYRPGCKTPLLRMPSTHDEFSHEECIALKEYYCTDRKIKIAMSYRSRSKFPAHAPTQRARRK